MKIRITNLKTLKTIGNTLWNIPLIFQLVSRLSTFYVAHWRRPSIRLGYLYIFVMFIAIVSCNHEPISLSILSDQDLTDQLNIISPNGDKDYYIIPDGSDLSEIPQDPKNPLNEVKIELGQYLFHETGIALHAEHESNNETYSCASCHVAAAGFKPGRYQGIADGGSGFGILGEDRTIDENYEPAELDAQGARPLSILNVAYVENTMWNGQFGSFGVNVGTEHLWDGIRETNNLGLSGIEAQNIEGLELHRMFVDEEIVDQLGYRDLFDEAFPDFAEEERYSNHTAAFAISAYIRTVLANKAPFQEWLRGDTEAMTEQEKSGGALFFGQAGCYRCHNSKALGSLTFHALGVNDLWMRADVYNAPSDETRLLGRGGFTGEDEDMYKFKVPQLYNLRDTPFYFHGSSKESIRDVVEYFNEGISENPIISKDRISDYFTPLYLDDDDIDDITAFLDNALRDPDLVRYAPGSVYSGNCIPNNDPASQTQIGCESD